MGKKRIQAMGEGAENQNKKKKIDKKDPLAGKKDIKTGKGQGRLADIGEQALEEAKAIEEKEKKLEKELTQKAKEEGKKETKTKKKKSANYLQALKKIDKEKFYPLEEAVKLLKEVSISKFKGSVEVHLNVKEAGIKGEVEFPHPTGKKQIIRIADDKLIEELEKGKINFTILVSDSKMMAKLVKFAKLLGPKGLMPNPKSGTINDNPKEVVEGLTKKNTFKTESKSPLIHMVIGKVDDADKNIGENFTVLIKAIGKKNIKKAMLAPTIGPSIKVDLAKI